MMRNAFPFLHRFFTFSIIVLLETRCAQIMPLSGGEKDVTPPKIIRQYPENNALQFKGNFIEIEFDEFFQLKNFQEQLIVSPRLSANPTTEINGKTLRINLNGDLVPNRTHVFSLGSSIADIHEGNTVPDLKITFSTGNSLDSGSISGNIVDALSNQPLADIGVFLYESGDDSCVFKRKPDYFGKSDKQGNYRINSIYPGKYKIIALGDKNKNFIYDQAEELIDVAFTNEKNLVLLHDSCIQNFCVYRERPSMMFVKRVVSNFKGKSTVILNRSLSKPELKLLSGTQGYVGHWFSSNGDTLSLFYDETLPDTSQWLIFETDETVVNKKQFADTFQVVKRKSTNKNSASSIFTPKIQYDAETDELTINFSNWFSDIKTNKGFFISSRDTIQLKTEVISKHQLKLNNKSEIIGDGKFVFPSGIFKNHLGEYNDTIIVSYQRTGASATSQLEIDIKANNRVGAGIIELVDDRGNVIRSKLSLTIEKVDKVVWNMIPPGNYHLRFIEDSDLNGVWTTGDIFLQRKPEKVYHYQKSISLIADWESNVNWSLGE